ncbi:ral guanine nucleotide dissociation stimulator-like 3 isoform X1 [Pleurodeles waltl]|uniref:ral guanine nucleotide dissociation stimulator-like 3 isoform X1 n=2 Tax=Pleurodeles waltl TaxID=8319 RepID=UPI003709B630
MSVMEVSEPKRLGMGLEQVGRSLESLMQTVRPMDSEEHKRRPSERRENPWSPTENREQIEKPKNTLEQLENPTESQQRAGRSTGSWEQLGRSTETREQPLGPIESHEEPISSTDSQEPRSSPAKNQEQTAEASMSICAHRARTERIMVKEITMNPLQEWGEEVEDGAIYGVTLRRVKMEPDGSDSGGHTVDPDTPLMPGCGFVQYKTCKLRTLKAGSLEKLVENLIATDGGSDNTYVPCFLATYRAFTSIEAVLALLLDRKLGCQEEDRSQWPGSPAPNTAGIHRVVRHILSIWMEEYPEDFRQKPQYGSLKIIQDYLRERPPGTEEEKESQQVSRLLQRFHEEDTEEEVRSPYRFSFIAPEDEAEPDVSEEKADLLAFPAEEVAEQLTLMDAELFRRVVPFHCLGCIWSQRDKKEKKHLAPTVRATVAQFNAVTNCVMASVLADVQLRAQQRAKILEKWISIAQKCRVLRNFSSLRAILSALQSNPIYRLKRAWAAVNRESVSTFHKLSDIFSDENNHLTSREILLQEEASAMNSNEHSCKEDSKLCQRSSAQDWNARPLQATVPYLGTFLTDLIMLDTALPDFLENGMINFEKRRKEYDVLSLILRLQQTCQHYCLSPRPQIVNVFVRHRQLTDDQSYRVSRTIEPPADSCPNSPRIRRRLTKRFSSLLLGSEVFGPRQNGDRGGISPSGSSSSCDMEDGLLSPMSCVLDGASAFPKSMLDLPLNSPTSVCSLDDSSSPAVSPTQPKQPVARVSSLPVYNQQIADLCIIRVSMENNHGNLYKSILLTSQDKTPTVILRALQKHNLDSCAPEEFQLIQLLDENREFVIPEKANVYYAMSTSVNFDFILRRKIISGPLPRPSTLAPLSRVPSSPSTLVPPSRTPTSPSTLAPSPRTPVSPTALLPLPRTANPPSSLQLLDGHSLQRLL